MDKKYFSIEDLSTYLNVSPRTIRYWIVKAQIPYFKFGRRIRFQIEKILRWEKSKEVPAFRKEYN